MTGTAAHAVSARPWPVRRLWLAVFVALAALITLSALYLRAEAVSPQAHTAYIEALRALRERDAQVNAEVLASRLNLTRNYDELTRQAERLHSGAVRLAELPAFLFDPYRERTEAAALQVLRSMQIKVELVEGFKRDNAVLRNSLSFFPVEVDTVLDAWSGPGEDLVESYARRVLVFARDPGERTRLAMLDAATELAAGERLPGQHSGLESLLRHGRLITEYQGGVDGAIGDILSLDSAYQQDRLSRAYLSGYLAASRLADRYRILMYVLGLLVAVGLALVYFRLERTGYSLARANQEVGERLAAQLRAEASMRLHATAFRNAHEGMTLTDATGRILDVNPAFTRITGFERDEVIGSNPRVLKSGRHDADFYAALWRSIRETGNWRGEIWNRNKYGEVYPELLSISAIHDADGVVQNYVAVFSDISRLKEQERQLTQLAYYDALTDLPNRSLLADRIHQAMLNVARSGSLVLVYLDLDGFKFVNDTWGHDAGDEVLVEMALRLRDCIRSGDTVARLGGDEFVLLLLGHTGEEQCAQAMQRLLSAITKPLQATPEPVSLSASIGVTVYPDDPVDADTLLRHADQAMYRAKQQGKNRWHRFDPIEDRDAHSRQQSVSQIATAMERDEFELYYQPKVDMRKGSVVGAEALLRWRHPERGVVPPVEFLPLIEDDDLILRLGDWVIESALMQMDLWAAQGLALAVSVNIAGRQLQQPDFVSRLETLLSRFPRVAGQLELEVVETTALDDLVKVSRVIEECRELGVGFALDDFGTGYSSLTYLRRLPASTIKIDQSFVREVTKDPHNLAIVQGVIGLATAFQRSVVAEGVETPDHARVLLQLNCEQAQGYGIARPMPAALLPGWIAEWQPPALWLRFASKRWLAEDYPMLLAEVEHRNWIGRLVYAVQAGQPVSERHLDSYEECAFGDWYFGRGARLYSRHAAFQRLDAPHRRVHALARDIDSAWRAGKTEEARRLVYDLIIQRDLVLEAMLDLQEAVGRTDGSV